jgi:hypothetical protein
MCNTIMILHIQYTNQMFRNQPPIRFIPVTTRIMHQQQKEAYKIQQMKNKRANQFIQKRNYFVNIPPPDPNKIGLIMCIIGIYLTVFKH